MHVSFKAIGRNIRAARTELGITQEDAAERLKISQLHFGRLERGERPASLEMLAKIAGVFGVSLTSARGLSSAPAPGRNRSASASLPSPTAARPRLSG